MDNNRNYPIGPLTGYAKPKYRVIQSILGEDFIPDKGMDIFIDLNTLVKTLGSSQKFMMSLPFAVNVEEDIISSILFIIKHWKDFTRKWDDIRIILIVNDFEMKDLCEYSQLNSYLVPFVNRYENDRFSQLVYYWNESIKRIKIVLDYVPNSYLIKCDKFDSYVIPNIISDYDKNTKRKRLIVTGHPMMTCYSLLPNTSVIFSRYKRSGMCQLSDPLMISQSISKIDDEIMNTFIKNKVFYNLLMIIIGDFERGIIGMTKTGITYFATNLLRSIEKREIPDDPKSIESILPAVDKVYHDYIIKSYPLMDIALHSSMVPQSLIMKVKSDMIDLMDIDGLRSLNVQGLNLLELL